MRRRQIQQARAEAEALARAAEPKVVAPAFAIPKELRERRGLSLEDVAEMTGMTRNYVRTVESMEAARNKILKALS